MPRLTREKKDARKAKADALKASETSNTGNNNNAPPASNCAPCGTSSGIVSAGGQTRVLTAGKSEQENATQSNASAAVQDKRAEKSTAEIVKERSDGGERGPGENKHQKVNEINASTVVQDKRAEKIRADIAKERSGGGERGPSHKSGEEEAVNLRPSQLESRQKQRDDRSSFAGNKGFRQDYNGRNSSASQNYEGYNSRQGGQHGYNDNRWRGRGGDNEGDSGRINALGRLLSRILRHQAPQLGLKVRSDGYVVVKDLLRLRTKTSAGLPLNAHSVDDLKEAVKRDDKQRFGLREENGQLLIRANQGHSLETINSVDLLEPVLSAEEVPVCMHGTYMEYLASIKKEGLKRMTRNHVHFAAGYSRQDGVISGVRHDCEVFIHMNVSKYLNDGMKLYRSENGVILAEGRDDEGRNNQHKFDVGNGSMDPSVVTVHEICLRIVDPIKGLLSS
ncbi:hypothetical protein SUGI_0528140 [Cryptomeria japonica]|nr:hypothetical protein SUGI_0528140 [Cryptomeria japonica]